MYTIFVPVAIDTFAISGIASNPRGLIRSVIIWSLHGRCHRRLIVHHPRGPGWQGAGAGLDDLDSDDQPQTADVPQTPTYRPEAYSRLVGWLGTTLRDLPGLGLALLDAPVVIASFFGLVILVSLGRVPDAVQPVFYGGPAALLLAGLVAVLMTRERRRGWRQGR